MRTRRTTLVKERPPLPLTVVGAGRGAREALPALVELGLTRRLAPLYLDAAPGQALALADEAKRQGLAATALEARIEDALDELPPEQLEHVTLNLDHGTPIADFLERAPQARHVMAYQLLKPALGPLYGLRLYLAPDALEQRMEVAIFFRTIGNLTVRRGSRAIVGEQGSYEDRTAEPLLRAWMAQHTREVLRKTLAHLPPDVAACEVTEDYGETTMPAYIQGGVAFADDPERLARRILENPPAPMLREQEFMIIEMVPGLGVRWHKAALKVNGRLRMDRAISETQPPVAGLPVAADQETSGSIVLSRAAPREVTPTSPLFTTD